MVNEYVKFGFDVYASQGTDKFLMEKGIKCEFIDIDEVPELITKGKISIIINTPTRGNNPESEGFRLRRKASQYRVPVFTCIDTARVFLNAVKIEKYNEPVDYYAMSSFFE